MPIPVASLNHLLAKISASWQSSKTLRCILDFCCCTRLRHWRMSLNVNQISLSLIGQWISLVRMLPTNLVELWCGDHTNVLSATSVQAQCSIHCVIALLRNFSAIQLFFLISSAIQWFLHHSPREFLQASTLTKSTVQLESEPGHHSTTPFSAWGSYDSKIRHTVVLELPHVAES